MNIVLFALMLILVFYIGEVLGLMIFCENCSVLEPAKPFVWRIPFMKIEMLCKYVKMSFERMSLRPLKLYFGIKDRNILMLWRLADLIEEQ